LPSELLEDLEASAEILMKRNTREGVHLRKALDILSGLDVDSRACVRHGLVVDEILAEVQEGDFDLVVIGAQVVEGLIRYLLEDVTHQVVANIDRPVLVAKM
jgi:nucleotide-binding universal stress UspA family protein